MSKSEWKPMFSIPLQRSLSKNWELKNETTAAQLNIEVSFPHPSPLFPSLPPFPLSPSFHDSSVPPFRGMCKSSSKIFSTHFSIYSFNPCLLSRGPCINDNVLIADRVSSKSRISRIEQGIKEYSNSVIGKEKKKKFRRIYSLSKFARFSNRWAVQRFH